MELEEAYNLIEKAVAAGRPANGYLVVGALRLNGVSFLGQPP